MCIYTLKKKKIKFICLRSIFRTSLLARIEPQYLVVSRGVKFVVNILFQNLIILFFKFLFQVIIYLKEQPVQRYIIAFFFYIKLRNLKKRDCFFS